MYWVVLVVLVVFQFWVVWRLLVPSRTPDTLTHPVRPPELVDALDRADLLAMNGDVDHAREAIEPTRERIERLQGPDGAALRVRFRAIYAEILRGFGRHDLARQALAEAGPMLPAIEPEELRDALAARVGAQTLLSTPSGEIGEEAVAAAARALELEPRVRRPEVRVLLVWAAHWLGQFHHQRGDWTRARADLERAVAIAEKLELPDTAITDATWDEHARRQFWSFGRIAASAAARQIAEVAVTLGDRSTASEWYARSVKILEGATLVSARQARAHAMASRAFGEPLDVIEAASKRVIRFEQALAEANGIGEPGGFAIATQLEMELAGMHADMGDAAASRAHLERAVETAQKAGEDAVVLLARARFSLARHLENECENDEAREVLESVWKTWASHPDPNLRHLAAVAGVGLHRLLDRPGEVERGGRLLDELDKAVPGLPAPQRAPQRACLCRARGVQLRRELRNEEADVRLREAIALAGELETDERHPLQQQAEMQLAQMLVDSRRYPEADEHFTAALAVPESPGDGSSPIGRANILLHRAKNRSELGRDREAARDLQQALRLGRDSGSAAGRLTAATAALALGDLEMDSAEERKRCYETAALLGRMSGKPQGIELSEAAERRLKERTE